MQGESRVHAACTHFAASLLLAAPLWDLLGVAALLPPWWPPVSYVPIAAGIAAATAAVLLGMLLHRRAPARRTRALQQLGALGIMLGAWLLRGDAEVPPEAPLVAAELFAAALYAWTLRSAPPTE